MIYSWIILGIFFFSFTNSGFADETTEDQVGTKEALHTVSKFLKEDGGTTWLSSLTAGRSAPLTTEQLMIEILNSTVANEEIKAAANIIKVALEEKRIGSNDTVASELDGWKDLVDNVMDQDDIVCLYQKSLNISSERTEDWQKFLKNVAPGHIVYLALDMGQKYIICLKKIQILEQNSSSVRSLNFSEPEARVLPETKIPPETKDLPEPSSTFTIPTGSGSRSFNGRPSLEDSGENEKCNNRNDYDINMRRQFMPVPPLYQVHPCNKPIIYMVPFGVYNSWSGHSENSPSYFNPAIPVMNPGNLPPAPSYPRFPMMNPTNFAGPRNSDLPIMSSAKIPANSGHPPMRSVPGIPNPGYTIMRSANPPKVPSNPLKVPSNAPAVPINSPKVPSNPPKIPSNPPGAPNPMMITNLKPRVPSFPSMRSVPKPELQNWGYRKTLPASSESQRRQYPPGSSGSQIPAPQMPKLPAQSQSNSQPPRRFFQHPVQSPRFIHSLSPPAYHASRLPDSWKPYGSPRIYLAANEFQPNYGLYPNYYSSYPSNMPTADQNVGPSCRSYLPCAPPCDKPLLVRVLIEPSQNPAKDGSNMAFIPQNNQIFPWRRNMSPNSNIAIQKESEDNNNDSDEKEENSSLEGSEPVSSETSISSVNEGIN